jgi:uncharacterized protein
MVEHSKYAPGTPCWIELATTDLDAAKKFYGDVLGWDDYEVGGEDTGFYTVPQRSGKRIAGMMTQQDAEKEMGVPPHWNSYVSVKSADDAAKKAAGLGGTVLVEPFDVMDLGRMAVFMDPQGAAICVWQPMSHHGAEVTQEQGTLCWNELHTTDADKAKAFYGDLFGWKAEVHGDPMPYTEWKVGDDTVGGMMEITPQMGPMPPNWLVYFAVTDTDDTAAKAKKAGGNVMAEPMDIPNVGRFSVIADPQGAVFAVIKMGAAG